MPPPARTGHRVTGLETADTIPELAALMSRIRTVATEGSERIASQFDLSPGQFTALLAVEDGAVNVSAVAQQCFTHLSNASRTLDTLVRDGLVDRSRDPDDRRSVRLSLTSAGQRRVAQLHEHRDEVMEVALEGFDPAEKATMVALLQRLVTGLESAILGAADDPDDA